MRKLKKRIRLKKKKIQLLVYFFRWADIVLHAYLCDTETQQKGALLTQMFFSLLGNLFFSSGPQCDQILNFLWQWFFSFNNVLVYMVMPLQGYLHLKRKNCRWTQDLETTLWLQTFHKSSLNHASKENSLFFHPVPFGAVTS